MYQGLPSIGPIDEVYAQRNSQDWDIALGMRWYPQDFIFRKDELKARERILKEIGRRRDLIDNVATTYSSLIQELMKENSISKVKSKVHSKLKVQQLIAELDALTGFKFNLSEKEY